VRKEFILPVSIGLVVVVAMVSAILYVQRGAHIELKGRIQKVRTLAADDSSAIAVVDFTFVNAADFPFVVRRVDVSLDTKSGIKVEGVPISGVDTDRLFQYYPVLGQKFNDSLLMKTKIAPHQSMDRMIAVRFEVPEKDVQDRKRLLVRVEDVDGAISDIQETR
jgi:hypothetical protein